MMSLSRGCTGAPQGNSPVVSLHFCSHPALHTLVCWALTATPGLSLSPRTALGKVWPLGRHLLSSPPPSPHPPTLLPCSSHCSPRGGHHCHLVSHKTTPSCQLTLATYISMKAIFWLLQWFKNARKSSNYSHGRLWFPFSWHLIHSYTCLCL